MQTAQMQTPWGPAQTVEQIADGIVWVDTAGHGGVHLDPTLNAQVRAEWRKPDGWYEHDCDWAAVALTFPEYFTDKAVAAAHEVAKRWMPDQYKAIFGGQDNERTTTTMTDNGGNTTMTEATVELHRPEPREDQCWARVALDDTRAYDGLLTEGRLWNGHECPAFPRDQVELMLADFDTAAAELPDALVDTLRWDGDTLLVVSGQYNTDGDGLREGDEPWIERVEPDANGLYSVGMNDWCWYRVYHELVLTQDGKYEHLSWGACSCGEWSTAGASNPAFLPEKFEREHIAALAKEAANQ